MFAGHIGDNGSNILLAISYQLLADLHEIKGVVIKYMLSQLYDLDFDLKPGLDLGFSRSDFEIAISQECWLTKKEIDESR